MSTKIWSLEFMAEKMEERRKSGRRTILAHGCFDLLHIGHIRYLDAARKFGDDLFVTISPDRFVDKGPNRPAFSEMLRAEALASLRTVDGVAVNKWPTADELLRFLRPDVYVKGSDFKSPDSDPTGKLQQEAETCRELGIELRFTEEIVFSSTKLINQFFSDYPEEIREYLAAFKRRHSPDSVMDVLDSFRKLRVFILGDMIIDEYCYCNLLGLSSKYPAVTVRKLNADSFPGGVMAIANHMAQFVDHVDMATVVGSDPADALWIRERLDKSVVPHMFRSAGAETMRKTRYFENSHMTKLLEIYSTEEASPPPEGEDGYIDGLKRLLAGNDLVIAADFGHGAITPKTRKMLCGQDVFLAVNTQCNAGNRSMHTISSYERADYVSITENELRRDRHDRHTPLRTLISRSVGDFRSRYFTATRGRQGICIAASNGEILESPALSLNPKDTVGAGDAVLALSALAAYAGAPAEVIAFLGNVAGALASQVIGNASPMTRSDVEKFLTSLLK